MTNKEILAQLKKSYEYLYDIRENGCDDHCSGQLESKLFDKLDVAITEIIKVYYEFYKTLGIEDLIIKDDYQDSEDYNIFISDNVEMDYLVVNQGVGSNFYSQAEDFSDNYEWYNDEDFINE